MSFEYLGPRVMVHYYGCLIAAYCLPDQHCQTGKPDHFGNQLPHIIATTGMMPVLNFMIPLLFVHQPEEFYVID